MSLNKKASLLFLICVILFLSLSSMLAFVSNGDANLLFLLNSLAVSIPSFLLPAIFFRRKCGLPRFKAPKASHLLIALGLGIGCIIMNQALSYLTNAIFSGVEINSNSTTADTIRGLNGWNMLISLAIIPPLSEEFLMRGTLLESWRRYSPVGAAILTSVLFGLLHAAPSSLLIYIGIGLLLAAVYLITRNVWLCVTVHFVNNLASVLAALALKLYPIEESETAVEEVVDTSAFTAWFGGAAKDIVLFILFAAIACAVIIPLLSALKNSCKKNGLGRYSAEAADEIAALSVSGEMAPQPYKPSMWSDTLLWLTVVLLVLLNVIAGFVEFGVINL